MHSVLDNVDFGGHTLAERPEPGRHELELHFEKLLLNDRWNVNLDLQVQRVIRCDTL